MFMPVWQGCTSSVRDLSVFLNALTAKHKFTHLVTEDDKKTELLDAAGLTNILGNVERDIPLAFSDRTFVLNSTGEGAALVFPHGTTDGNGGALPPFSILPEMFGYTMTVNGVIYPIFNVSPDGYYLLRLLNTCDR